jgi:hypothetical protein
MTLNFRRRHWPIVASSVRAGIGMCLVSTALTVGGCAAQSGLRGASVILDTAAGPLAMNPPVLAMADRGAAGSAGAMPGQAVNRDGQYAGSAVVLVTNGGSCIQPLAVSGFVVQGNSSQFGGFHGTIDETGGLQMVYGGTWIVGQFRDAVFRGQLTVSGPRWELGCSYLVNLHRIGS